MSVRFPLAAVANKWLPICNPRALINASGPVAVRVVDRVPVIEGFKPFEVHFERAPPIHPSELDEIAPIGPRIRRSDDGLTFRARDRIQCCFTTTVGDLPVEGRPEFFRARSDHEAVLKVIQKVLGACVHDDADAHWFVPLDLAPDGFPCHWIGRASATCTRPR